MGRDLGSRDAGFLALNREVLERLAEIANASGTHVAVPIPGSGTFAVEAMLTTLVPRTGKVLLLVNGVRGQRAKRICLVAGRRIAVHETREEAPPDLEALDGALRADPTITHVFVVHCETASGILNPVAEIADVVATHGRRLLIDAASAFGALPLDAASTTFDAVAAASDRCLEGVPGLGFVICREASLAQARGNAASLALDLHDQWQHLATTGRYRFASLTQVIAALHQALGELRAEGGPPGRNRRYAQNCKVLIEGMRELGFRPLLPERLQSPILVAFRMPKAGKFLFHDFCDKLEARGYVIDPGTHGLYGCFHIGCIGRLDAGHMRGAVSAVAEVLAELGISSLGSAA
jgi:2-aminoethylphosphonate-pyruvate transaminase